MKRKSSHKQFAVRRHHKEGKGWRYAVLLGVMVLVVYAVLIFAYHVSHHDETQTPGTFYAEKISDWMAERKAKSKKVNKPVKRKVLSQNHEEPQIHFEFYNSLPNAKMPELRSGKRTPKQMIADADQLERDILEAAQRGRSKH